jgi:RimJ/RimL family protein N-acetyltransferase
MDTYYATHPAYQEFDLHTVGGFPLRLVQPEMKHAVDSLRWVTNTEAVRLMGGDFSDVSLAGEEEQLRSIIKDHNAYHWIIVLDGRAVGNINLHDIAETSQRFNTKAATFAILLGDDGSWGKGVATAALQAVAAWAIHYADFSLISARAVTQNRGSIRLLEKVGFVSTGTEAYDGPDFGEATLWHTYVLTPATWRK